MSVERTDFHARLAYAVEKAVEVGRLFVHDKVPGAAVLDLAVDAPGEVPGWRDARQLPDGVCALQEEVPVERAVELLWRGGEVPHWIFLALRSVDAWKARILAIVSESYVGDVVDCEVQFTGLEPIHVMPPRPPGGWESLEREGPFSLDSWRRPTPSSLAELELPKQVCDLRLPGMRVGTGELRYLERFWDLRSLILDDAELGDGDLEALAGFGKLGHLCLDRTSIGDEGIATLSRIGGLRGLSLGDTGLGDEGMAAIAGLKQLRYLRAAGTAISDASLEHLTPLTELTYLDLSRTCLRGSLAPLAACRNLEVLDLTDTEVDAGSLDGIAGLPALHSLHLGGTRVGDEAVGTLRSFEKLRTLDLVDAPVGEGGLLELLADPTVLPAIERVRVRDELLGKELMARICEARSRIEITGAAVS